MTRADDEPLDCFACGPAPPAVEAPWQWSRPRALCPSHKMRLRMEDGADLYSLLKRVALASQQLEGSVLGWIFNPVLIDTGAGEGLRGWTDFIAGGMAVYEDHFQARNYFEFRAFEMDRAVDLLYVVRTIAAEGQRGAPKTLAEFAALLAQHAACVPSSLQPPHRGPFAGLEELQRVWAFQEELRRLRHAAKTLWPRTHDELMEWTERCFGASRGQSSDHGKFLAALWELSVRRFPRL